MRRLTAAMEDYLKAIYKLQQQAGSATTQALARLLKVKPASATNMLKKLARLKLVRYSAYRGVQCERKKSKTAVGSSNVRCKP